jgi:hypothetical protein
VLLILVQLCHVVCFPLQNINVADKRNEDADNSDTWNDSQLSDSSLKQKVSMLIRCSIFLEPKLSASACCIELECKVSGWGGWVDQIFLLPLVMTSLSCLLDIPCMDLSHLLLLQVLQRYSDPIHPPIVHNPEPVLSTLHPHSLSS